MKKMAKVGLAVVVLMLMVSVAFAEYIPFKVSLTPSERLNVMSVLPQKDNIVTLRIVSNLEQEIGLTEEEMDIIGFIIENGRVINLGKLTEEDWNRVPAKEFTLGEIAKQLIADALKELSRREELQKYQLSIYDKFVGVE